METTNTQTQLEGIFALNLLFYNYDNEQLNEMLDIQDFKYNWEKYLDFDNLTHMQLWEMFNQRFSMDTRHKLLEIAEKYYGKQAKSSVQFGLNVKKMFAKYESK